jgi:hypothetical protein
VGLGRRLVRLLPGGARATAGLFMTIAVVISWTLGLWASWTIALLDPAVELIRTADREPLGPIDTIYLAGFSVFTLGTGDVAPATTVGRLVTVVAAATGLFTVTLEVTYLLSLTSAAAHERSTARHTYALGSDVGVIVRRRTGTGRSGSSNRCWRSSPPTSATSPSTTGPSRCSTTCSHGNARSRSARRCSPSPTRWTCSATPHRPRRGSARWPTSRSPRRWTG